MVLTREERVMVQASINNERDFDKVADALIIQHPRIHLGERCQRTKGKGKDGIKSNDNFNIRRLQEKDKKNTRNGKLGASAHHADFTFAEHYGHNDSKVETADAYRAHDDSVNPGSEVGEEALDCEDDKKYDMFSSKITLDDVSIVEAAGLDAFALPADTWDNGLDPEVSAQLVQANVRAYLFFRKEKGKSKGKGKFPVRSSRLPSNDRCQQLRELREKLNSMLAVAKGGVSASERRSHPSLSRKRSSRHRLESHWF